MRLQLVWWGWASWAFRFRRFRPEEGLSLIYDWSFNLGPLEVRKWNRRCLKWVWRNAPHGGTPYRDAKLRYQVAVARIAELERDCADMAEDVFVQAFHDYGDGKGGIHPALRGKFERDIETARKYLSAERLADAKESR